MPSGVDYRDAAAKIAAHFRANLSSSTYFVTNDYSVVLSGNEYPVILCVLFGGVQQQPELSQTAGQHTRVATFPMIVATNVDDSLKADELVDDAISDVEHWGNHPNNGSPRFAVYAPSGQPLFEWAKVMSGVKGVNPRFRGIHAKFVLECRILEV